MSFYQNDIWKDLGGEIIAEKDTVDYYIEF